METVVATALGRTARPGLARRARPSRPARVPYHTHDVGEDGARGADERAHDGQQVVVEQEALSTQGPARVAVQHCDDHRHVRSPDGGRQSHALGRKASAARSSENKK